jgi:hypothetical protein
MSRGRYRESDVARCDVMERETGRESTTTTTTTAAAICYTKLRYRIYSKNKNNSSSSSSNNKATVRYGTVSVVSVCVAADFFDCATIIILQKKKWHPTNNIMV